MESELNLLKKCRLYHKYFKDIKGIRFTEREIDIIICIFYEKADKKIASILGMSHRTVSTHIHNISNKIGYSTKDQIICFVQKQQPAPIIHLCYAILQTDYHLSLALSKINQLQKLYLASNNSFEGGFDLTKKTYIKNYSFEDKESNKIFKNHLKILGIDVANSNSGKEDLNHIEIHQDKIIKGSYFQFIFQFIRKIIPESLFLN